MVVFRKTGCQHREVIMRCPQRPVRLLLCLLAVLTLAAPAHGAQATRATQKQAAPADPDAAVMLLTNESRQDLVAIRISSGETTSFARVDLVPGDEDEVENPGGTASVRLDLGLSLAQWDNVQLDHVLRLALCGSHDCCLAVTRAEGEAAHMKGTSRSLLPPPDSTPACSLDGFHAGMTMMDACGLLRDYDAMEEHIMLAPMGFAGIVWSARLYAGEESGEDLKNTQLESVELRQRLSDDNVNAVLAALARLKYVPWQATFPGAELTFTEMLSYTPGDRGSILNACLKAFRSQSSGSGVIQYVPEALMKTLTSLQVPRGTTQIYTLTLHNDARTLSLDMSAYTFDELQLQ